MKSLLWLLVFATCSALFAKADDTGRDDKQYGRGKPANEHPTLGRATNRLDRRPDDNRQDRYPDSYPNRLDSYPDRVDGYPDRYDDRYGDGYPYGYDNSYADYYPDSYSGGYDYRYPSRYPDRYSERYRYGEPCGPYSWYYRDDCRRYNPRRPNHRRRRVCKDNWYGGSGRNPWLCS